MERLSLSAPRLWLGRDEPPVAPRHMHLGRLSFDLDGIDPRRIGLDGVEAVNRIYVSVRDTDWNTLVPVVRDLVVEDTVDGDLSVRFDARHDGAGIALSWRGTIVASGDGRLTYEMDGQAEADFRYNRIGFCVLHPAALAGRPYRADTATGLVAGELPDLVEPQSVVEGLEVPLFPACSGLAVDVAPGVTATMTFEGDRFEMEDQRNWSDGSFKTYCTPIALGYPHRATKGQRFRQRIELTIATQRPVDTRRAAAAEQGGAPVRVDVGEQVDAAWPKLGLGMRSGPVIGGLEADDRLRIGDLRLDHLRLDLRLSDPRWPDRLDAALADADAVAARLEVALFGSEATGGQLAAAAARLVDPRVCRVIALHEPTARIATTPAEWLDRVANAFADVRAHRGGGGPDLLTGTDGDFAELNRTRPDLLRAGGVAYAMNPQVHAFDELSIVESLPAQADTVRTARSFSGGRLVVVSPVTLRPRFNPAAEDPTAAVVAVPPADHRQPSLFAAGWLLGSIASLAGANVDAITYFEVTGPRGVIGPSADETAATAEVRLPAGVVYPAWFVLADLADRADLARVAVAPATGPVIAAVATRDGAGTTRVLVANLGLEPLALSIGPLPGTAARIRTLDATTAPDALVEPGRHLAPDREVPIVGGRVDVHVDSFGYTRIDAGGG